MEDLFNQLVAWLATVNPLYAFAALAVWMLFGDKIKALLSRIPLPKFPPSPSKPKDEPNSGPSDPLEDNPLLDLIWQRLKKKWTEHPGEDEDKLAKLVKAIKDTQ